MIKKIVVSQLGCGYWGPNLLRSFSSEPGCEVRWVADQREERRQYVRNNFPLSRVTTSSREAMEDPEVEAILVATPAATHFELVKTALELGKHVFVEKPLATRVHEAEELARLAESKGRVLMVGHTFLYNPAVRFLKNYIDKGELGRIHYIYCQRLNLGQVREDVNVWWNLAPHDISILLYLFDGKLPTSVFASGKDFIQKGIEDIAFGIFTWRDGTMAQIHNSWLDPGKVRKITVVGSRRMIIYDDLIDDKIAIFDKGVDRVPAAPDRRMDYDRFDKFQLLHRAGDVWLPRIEFKEPLKIEASHFLECVRSGANPLSGPRHAVDVVRCLEAGMDSMESRREVELLSPIDVKKAA